MMEHIEKQLIVPRELHQQRIDSVIAQLLPEYSRSLISTWIKTGAVTVNKKTCKPKDKIQSGDEVLINVNLVPSALSIEQSQAEDIPLEVVYEDDHLLVINKPAGLVVHPGAGNKEHTLVNALLHHAPSLQLLPRAGIIHRLDKETTGLLIVAKSLTAHTALIRQMQAREIDRDYLALVQGHVISGGTIDTGFGRHSRNRLKMSVTGNGRQAITHYKINKQYGDFTLVDVSLMTGRTHQIRVHMAHINHPVVGDPLYGGRMRLPAQGSDQLRAQLQQFKRQALHAYSLSFEHPVSHETLFFTAELPEDFASLLHVLDEHYDL